MKRKLISTLLSCGLALSLLVGCGNTSTDKQENETLIESESTTASEEEAISTEESIEEAFTQQEETSIIESEETLTQTATDTADTASASGNEATSEVALSSETPVVETPIQNGVEAPQEAASNEVEAPQEVASNEVEAPQEVASSETAATTTTLYSVDECVSIIKSTLINAGYEWYPDSDEYRECRELYPDIYIGPDGGMGWGIDYVDMSDPYSYVQNAIVTFKHNRWESFYFEILSVSNGEMELKFYRG
jgi:hypothetical protein